MFDGILWILRAGAPWRDLPEEFGNWSTVWDYFDRWNSEGLLADVLNLLVASHVDVGAIDPAL
jgi:transposase